MNTRVTNLIAAVLITLVVLSGYATHTSVVSDDLPAHIHLTWQRNNTSHTMIVTWQTAKSTAGDIVLYDTVPRNGNVPLYRYSAAGNHHTYSGASGVIHDVELIDLAPDTLYYFICGGEGGYSSERCFRTAPTFSYHVRFVVGGDARTQWWERDKISQAMSVFNSSFVLLSGDLVENGDDQTQWDSFFEHIDSYWITQDNLTIPIIPCLGNHENNSTKYYEQFALSNNEQWYSLNWGANIHIICLNSETDSAGLEAQRDWLENDLAQTSSTWKFVFFHRPPFPSDHDAWTPALTYFVPLFDKYQVDVVFLAHSHNYHRSKPINWAVSNSSPQSYYWKETRGRRQGGTMYVVSGGWGAPLHAVSDWWGWACAESIYNFVVVDVYFNSLHLQAKDNMGNTLDEIWFHHLDC